MPMLYVIQKGFNGVTPCPAEDIIYCVSSVQQIISHKLDFVFTNGHAVNSFSSVFYPPDVDNIENIIDMHAIKAKYWKDEHDLDLKRRMEAEFLVSEDIPETALLGFVVYNEKAKKILASTGTKKKIFVTPDYYF
jgi:hypothetical protein